MPTSRRISSGYDPSLDFEGRGPAGVCKLAAVLRGGLSDIAMPVDESVAEGDRALARLRFQGWHTGAFEGLPATGQLVNIVVMDLFWVAAGRIVERWASMDYLTVLKQLGTVET